MGLAIGLYIVILLSLLNWGLPGKDRVFVYHMDEWHQLKAIEAIWQQGTNNVAGAAHGPMFHFLISGAFLGVFKLIGLVKPELISSAVTGLEMQQMIFKLLRLNTLLFGLGAIWVLYLILTRAFKIKPEMGLLLFIFSPVWLISSNYFKYDVGLIFWILSALYLMMLFGKELTGKRYLQAGIATGLALATKISALPLAGLYIFSYFFYQRDWRKHLMWLVYGGAGLLLVFVFLGIPDVLFNRVNWREYQEFFQSNLVINPQDTANYWLNRPWWWQLVLITLPINLGYGLSFAWLGSVLKAKKILNKDGWLVLIGGIWFFLSLLVLKLSAGGNRSMVLLPFMAILAGDYLSRLKSKSGQALAWLAVIGQVVSGIWLISPKWQADPRVTASEWIRVNLPLGTEIGLEAVPIYQMIPDLLLKDMYDQEYGLDAGEYRYRTVSGKVSELPSVVIVTNGDKTKLVKQSSKKDLISRLEKEGYLKAADFATKTMEINYIPSSISVWYSGIN